MKILNWLLSRLALDPDAASCAIIVALLLVLMIVTVVIWTAWRAVYISLWRWNRRRKKQRR